MFEGMPESHYVFRKISLKELQDNPIKSKIKFRKNFLRTPRRIFLKNLRINYWRNCRRKTWKNPQRTIEVFFIPKEFPGGQIWTINRQIVDHSEKLEYFFKWIFCLSLKIHNISLRNATRKCIRRMSQKIAPKNPHRIFAGLPTEITPHMSPGVSVEVFPNQLRAQRIQDLRAAELLQRLPK